MPDVIVPQRAEDLRLIDSPADKQLSAAKKIIENKKVAAT
jgi:hypothetical protein